MTVSKPENNNSPSGVRYPPQNVALGILLCSRAVDEEAKYKQA